MKSQPAISECTFQVHIATAPDAPQSWRVVAGGLTRRAAQRLAKAYRAERGFAARVVDTAPSPKEQAMIDAEIDAARQVRHG